MFVITRDFTVCLPFHNLESIRVWVVLPRVTLFVYSLQATVPDVIETADQVVINVRTSHSQPSDPPTCPSPPHSARLLSTSLSLCTCKQWIGNAIGSTTGTPLVCDYVPQPNTEGHNLKDKDTVYQVCSVVELTDSKGPAEIAALA